MNDLLYTIALTLVNGIGDVHAKLLIQEYETAESVFKAKKKDLQQIEGIGTARATAIKSFADFSIAEAELRFIEKHRIRPLYFKDPGYPRRLLNCYDNPLLLYYCGTADLNQSKIVSVVGTRNNTEYGKMVCEQFIESIKETGALIVSGLAFGIDTIAHKNALKQELDTVAVLAHGLDRIYPSQNKLLAKEIITQGGLLTDSVSKTLPDKQNFPKRNRIVAGMCDAVVVVESSKKGGSLITAEIANSYNKDVFAIPGRINDLKSEGCNYLVKNNKAMLINGAVDFIEIMNWMPQASKPLRKQRALFIELDKDEKLLLDILSGQESVAIDELYLKSSLTSSSVARALLMLEMQNLVLVLPGKLYKAI